MQKLRYARFERGLTLQEASELSGITANKINLWEHDVNIKEVGEIRAHYIREIYKIPTVLALIENSLVSDLALNKSDRVIFEHRIHETAKYVSNALAIKFPQLEFRLYRTYKCTAVAIFKNKGGRHG